MRDEGKLLDITVQYCISPQRTCDESRYMLRYSSIRINRSARANLSFSVALICAAAAHHLSINSNILVDAAPIYIMHINCSCCCWLWHTAKSAEGGGGGERCPDKTTTTDHVRNLTGNKRRVVHLDARARVLCFTVRCIRAALLRLPCDL